MKAKTDKATAMTLELTGNVYVNRYAGSKLISHEKINQAVVLNVVLAALVQGIQLLDECYKLPQVKASVKRGK